MSMLTLAAASVPGLALWGYLSDRLPIAMVVTTNCVGAALSCLLLWGFGTSDTTLVFFVLSFGLLGLSFSALWTKLISIISRESHCPLVSNPDSCAMDIDTGR